MNAISRFFRLDEYDTTIGREAAAGLTTFLTMSYIIFVNPAILSETGMDTRGLFVATILVSSVSTILMGLWANLPYALAPGMGLNAFFAYTMVLGKGIDWRVALGATIISGLVFVVLTAINIRRLIVVAIPGTLRLGIACGIGLFIAFIGLKNAGMIVASPATLVTLGDFDTGLFLFLGGLLLTSILLIYRVRGSFLIGIIGTTLAALILGLVELPDEIISHPSTGTVFLQADIRGALSIAMIAPIFTMLMTDMFDSISSFVGIAQVDPDHLIDEDGQPRAVQEALFVDSIATISAGIFGSSAGTTYIESAAGVVQGGRTGLTAVVTGLIFLPFLFIANLAAVVPPYATAPALVIAGLLMFGRIGRIDFKRYDEAIPAFLAIILIPLTYSITQGIVWGFISYTLLKILAGKRSELHPMMYIIAILSVLILAVE